MTTVAETPHVSVRWHAGSRVVELAWTPTFAPSRALRAALTELVPSLRTLSATRWLCDHHHLRIVGPEDLGWVLTQWMPSWSAASESACSIAVVQATDFFGRRSTTRFFEEVRARRPAARLQVFDARGPALAWLVRSSMEVVG